MASTLYVLVVTVLLLFALAITLPVIRDILLEGMERHRQQNDRDGRETFDTEDDDTTQSVRCSHCGAANDADYDFCQQCTEPL